MLECNSAKGDICIILWLSWITFCLFPLCLTLVCKMNLIRPISVTKQRNGKAAVLSAWRGEVSRVPSHLLALHPSLKFYITTFMCILFTPSFLMCLAVKTALMQRSPPFCPQAVFALNSSLQKSSQLYLVLLPEQQEALEFKRRDFKNESRIQREKKTIRKCQRNTLE